MITVIGTGTSTGTGSAQGAGAGPGTGAGTGAGTGTGEGTVAGGDERARAEALAEATLVVGARRHLDAAPLPPGAERVVLGPLAPALEAIEAHLGGTRPYPDGGPVGGTDPGRTPGPGTAEATGSRQDPATAPGPGAGATTPSGRSHVPEAYTDTAVHLETAAYDSPGTDNGHGPRTSDDGTTPPPGDGPGRDAGPHTSGDTAPPSGGDRGTAPARVVVLASGDPGFFGIVRALADRFGASALRVRPSVPSVALAFARTGLSWDDAAVVSAHGRDPRTAVNVCRSHPKTAVLTGPGCGPAELGAALAGTGIPRTLVVATALGAAGERVEHLSPAEAAARSWPDPVSVVICLDPARSVPPAQRALAGGHVPRARWALADEEFAHRDSMVTKYEVRALALARMAPGPGDLVWDVGAGSGSVAVECARLGAAAVAVEQASDGVGRIRANAAAHGVDVETVHGTAPGALGSLPDPDAVFVGGGGRSLPGIVSVCAARARRCVVVTLAALDRVPEVRTALSGAGLVTDGVLLNSSRLSPLPGDVTRLAATNPVFVLWGSVPGTGPGTTPGGASSAAAPAGAAADTPENTGTSEGAAP